MAMAAAAATEVATSRQKVTRRRPTWWPVAATMGGHPLSTIVAVVQDISATRTTPRMWPSPSR